MHGTSVCVLVCASVCTFFQFDAQPELTNTHTHPNTHTHKHTETHTHARIGVHFVFQFDAYGLS
jgi:hypothetical protein